MSPVDYFPIMVVVYLLGWPLAAACAITTVLVVFWLLRHETTP